MATTARAAAAPQVFDVQVVRKGSGDVVYIECDHDVVQWLGSVLHQPVGSLTRKLAELSPDLGLAKFGASFAALRPAIWNGIKDTMLPAAGFRPPPAPPPPPATKAPPSCLCKLPKLNAALQSLGMLRSNGNGYYHNGSTCSYCSARTCCASCRMCTECVKKLSQGLGPDKDATSDGDDVSIVPMTQTLPRFKETVKFLIDNELQVYENSSVTALGLMGKNKVELSSLKTERVVLGAEHLAYFIAHAMFNSRTILTDTLELVEAAPNANLPGGPGERVRRRARSNREDRR